MNLPNVGDLRHRVTFELRKSVPNDQAGFSNVTTSSFTVWGDIQPVGAQIFWNTSQIETTVTHRVFTRYIEGKTRPQDLTRLSQIEETVTHRVFTRYIEGKTRPQDLTRLIRIVCNGLKYRVRRVSDISGKDRFTVIDVQQEGVVQS